MEPGARRTWAAAGLVALLALLAYAPFLFLDSRGNWDTTDADEFFFDPHGTSSGLVLGMVVYLVWRVQGRLARLEAKPGPWPVTALLLGLGGAAFAWAIRADAPDTLAPSLVLALLGTAHLLGGLAALRVLALPVFVLFMIVPIPAPLLNHVLWSLQIWTAEYTGLLLFLIGEPGFVSGDRILQAGNIFAIIETCSGLRTVQTLLLLAVLMADLFGRRGLHALCLLALAPPVAFAVNGVRALLLIQIPGSDIAAVHSGQGIAMLLAGVLILYGFDGLLERYLRVPPRPKPPKVPRRPLVPRLALLAGYFAALGALVLWLPPWTLPPAAVPLIGSLPTQLDGWRSQELQSDWVFYGRLARRQAIHRRYAQRRDQVDLFMVSGAMASRDRSLLSPKTALPGSGWIVEEEGALEVGDREGLWRVVRSGTDRRLIQHHYVGLGGVAGESLRTAFALDSGPLRRPTEPYVVLLGTRLGAGPMGREAAERRLAAFRASLDAGLGSIANTL